MSLQGPASATQKAPAGLRRFVALGGVLALLATVVAWNLWPHEPPLDVLLNKGTEWLRVGQFERAQQLAEQALRQSPTCTAALFLGSRAASGRKQFAEAADFLERVASDDKYFAEAQIAAGENRLQLGDCQRAEQAWRTALDAQSGSTTAVRRLSDLYSVEGRSWERGPHLQALLRGEEATYFDLKGLAHPDLFAGPRSDLERFRQAAARDDAPLVGLAVVAYRTIEMAEAEEFARRAVQLNPQSLQGQPLLGWLLHQKGDDSAWLQWRMACPTVALEHPLTWTVQAAWLEDHGQFEPAVHCYLQALARDPSNAVANLRLGQRLPAVGQAKEAEYFQWRAEQLFALQKAIESIDQARQPTVEQFDIIARLLAGLGRWREAVAWRAIQAQAFPSNLGTRQALAQLRQHAHGRADIAAGPRGLGPPQLSADQFAPPDWDSLAKMGLAEHANSTDGGVSFVDRAEELGISFRYETGYKPQQGARFIRQNVGGGVAAIDYDGDAWPDLYFTQGCQWPPDPQQHEVIDRMFRQRGDGHFVDVTELAGLGDNGFSGGVATGDLDNDGWPDLYVANLGVNRLYRNNGDGTFDVLPTPAAKLPDVWTSSCLIADLNGDNTPDLYDVTYLGGDDLHTKVCGAHACEPRAFLAEEDRLWLASGDGLYRECGESAGIHADLGQGLGIVAADFDGSGRLSLFVANDQTPNFFFVNQTSQAGKEPRFEERGMTSGLAVDGWGRPQACMGVAAGDADGDGSLDLFVTNFVLESNVLYLNQGGGDLFGDATTRAGLREPSMPMVGFGTQFLDADLDGWPDLIVVNGHVDDYTAEELGFRMRPQFFRNLGGAQFAELMPASLGPCFSRESLGRGLARLDCNRDGREDAVVSNMEDLASLLINTTPQVGHFMALQLRGVQSTRDAFGTTVRVRAGDRTWVAQLTAGDGYMVSNQRQLLFGLGDRQRVDEVKVRWPSGLEQSFHDLPTDSEWILVEGGAELTPLPLDLADMPD